MTAQPIDGRELAGKIEERLIGEVKRLSESGTVPSLAGVLVGDSAAAVKFAAGQRKACDRIGIHYELVTLPGDSSREDLERVLADLASRPGCGIVLHRPLPEHLEGDHVPTLVPPRNDVEGVHPENLGRLMYRSGGLPPCTAMAAVDLLKSTGVEIRGKEAVVVGHSEIVGKPIALWLMNRLATTTVCHHGTVDLGAHTRQAEILFVAVGKPGLIRGDMVREGAIVIDIGINRVQAGTRDDGKPKFRTVGDVEADEVREVAGWLTPVPGGVGPVTVAKLLENTVNAALRDSMSPTPR